MIQTVTGPLACVGSGRGCLRPSVSPLCCGSALDPVLRHECASSLASLSPPLGPGFRLQSAEPGAVRPKSVGTPAAGRPRSRAPRCSAPLRVLEQRAPRDSLLGAASKALSLQRGLASGWPGEASVIQTRGAFCSRDHLNNSFALSVPTAFPSILCSFVSAPRVGRGWSEGQGLTPGAVGRGHGAALSPGTRGLGDDRARWPPSARMPFMCVVTRLSRR